MLAAKGSYIIPVDPRGYYPCTVFGKFPPSNSIRAKRLASHKRTSTEDASRLKSPLLLSGKRGRNRKLAKSLPPLHVTKMPYTHARDGKEPGQLLKEEILNSRIKDGQRIGYQKWWDLRKIDYQVKPTNFKNKNSCFNYKHSEIQPHLKGNRCGKQSNGHWTTNLSDIEHHDQSQTDGLNTPNPSLASSSCSSYLESVPSNHYLECRSHELESELSNCSLKPMDAKAATEWWYSRTRSGLRKPTGRLSQVYALDLVPNNECHIPYHQVYWDTTSKKETYRGAHLSSVQKASDASLLKKGDNGTKVPTRKMSIPKIVIEGEAVQEAVYPTRKHESEFRKNLKLLELSCEWMKVLQTYSNIPRGYPERIPTLTVVNLNGSLMFPSSSQECQEQIQTVGTHSTCSEYHCNTFAPAVSTCAVNSFPANLESPQKTEKDKLPSWLPSFRYKPDENFERTKPTNPHPDLMIFGHQINDFLNSGIELSKESRKELDRVAGLATSGEMKSEDVKIVQSIVKDVQAALDTSTAQMLDMPDSHDSYLQFQHLERDYAALDTSIAQVLDMPDPDTHDPYLQFQHLERDHEGIANSTQKSSSTEDCLSEADPDHFSSGNNSIASTDGQLSSEHYLNPADLGTVQPQGNKPKLDSSRQAKYSELENAVIESVREDLKYLKESMFSKPKAKQRESLLPSIKENVIKPSRVSRKLVGRAKNTSKFSRVSPTEKELFTEDEDSTTCEASEITTKESFSDEVSTELSSDELSMKLVNKTPLKKDHSDLSSIPSRAASKMSLPSTPIPHEHRAQSAKRESSAQLPIANLTMTFPGSNRRRAPLAPAPTRSMSKARAKRLPTEHSQFALDTLNELKDVRALTEGFLKTVNPPEMSISSRPTTREEGVSEQVRLVSRERASRVNSRRSGRRKSVQEQDPVRQVEPPQPMEEELARERMRLAKEKERRAKLLREQLEQSLDTKDSIRQKRREQAEARRQAEEAEQERLRLLELAKAQEEWRLEQERLKHEALLERFKREDDGRQNQQLWVCGTLGEYDCCLKMSEDYDYTYISYYLGNELSDNLREAERERIRLEKARLAALMQEAFDLQQAELIKKLRLAQREFMIGLENEEKELEHLLSLSRAFIYSYFEPVPEQTYCVPKELLLLL